MAKNTEHIQVSILDRLIDLEPHISREPAGGRHFTFDRLKAAVTRDLENLLNARRQILPIPADFAEVDKSVFSYGLPDFINQNPKSPSTRKDLEDSVSRIIVLFEPRLQKTSVKTDPFAKGERNIKLRITATLIIEPIREPVMFDALFDISKGEYKIPG